MAMHDDLPLRGSLWFAKAPRTRPYSIIRTSCAKPPLRDREEGEAKSLQLRSEPGRGRQRPRPGGALRLEQVGKPKREVDRLLSVEPRIAHRVIAILEVRVGDHARTAGALSDVLAGHLQMHAAAMSPFGAVNRKEGLHLGQNAVERPRLVAGFRADRVTVHGIAGPHHNLAFTLDRPDHGRKLIRDLVRAQPHDQAEAA